VGDELLQTPKPRRMTMLAPNERVKDYIHPESWEKLTDAQIEAFDRLLTRDLEVITPFACNYLMGCLFGQIRFRETGITMWFGIEPDGYTHT